MIKKTLEQVAYEAYWTHNGGGRPQCDQVQHQSSWEAGIKAAMAEHEARKWQGMETLPKDGLVIIGYREGPHWMQQFWSCDPQFQPFEKFTHWMWAPEGPR